MTSPVTHYTTYDLEYYYADLKRLPALSPEERQHLFTQVTTPAPQKTQGQQTTLKHRLIESYLPLAKHLAIALCPSTHYRRLFAELVGVSHLAVVQAVNRAECANIRDLDAYVTAHIRGAIKRTLVTDGLLRLPERLRQQARAAGTLASLYASARVVSLDEVLESTDIEELEELPMTPLTSSQAAPPRNPTQRAQVETWLSYLPARAQAILRLRYGLAEDNERAHSTAEIAQVLGLDRRLVLTAEREALQRLKAFVAGAATIQQRQGKPCITYTRAYHSPSLLPLHEQHLQQAATRLRERAIPLTIRALAAEAGLPLYLAQAYLRVHRLESPIESRARERLRRLEETSARLRKQGVRVTAVVLAREAHVMKLTAITLLKTHQEG